MIRRADNAHETALRHKSMPGRMPLPLLRLAILIYSFVLISSAWPFPTTPLLGPLGSAARAMLAEVSLEPGERIFPGSTNEMGAIADCISIEGSEGFGNWRELYRSDCPPTSRHDSIHQLHIDRLRAASKRVRPTNLFSHV